MSLSASLSGINSAIARIDTSANNIANINSTKTIDNGVEKNQPFVPSQVTDVSQGSGGVKSIVSPIQSSSVLQTNQLEQKADDNNSSIFPQTNVDLGQEAVNQIQAKTAFRANLQAFEAQTKTIDQVLNIIS